MKHNKRGMSTATIKTWLISILLIVVLFSALGDFLPTLFTAGDSINSSGMPLGSFFASGGAIWYILPIGLIVLLFAVFLSGKKK